MPLFIKRAAIKHYFRLFESKSTTLTLSNRGRFTLGREADAYIQKAEFILIPRLFATKDKERSAYNLGIISFKDELYLNFSRFNKDFRPEEIFMIRLKEINISSLINNS